MKKPRFSAIQLFLKIGLAKAIIGKYSNRMNSGTKYLRKVFIFGIKLAITAWLMALLLHKADMGVVRTQILSLNPAYMTLAALCLILQNIMVSWRWQWILKDYDQSISPLVAIRLTLEGSFFNQALPSIAGGDAIRVLRARDYQIPTRTAISSVLLDRIIGLVALLILATLGMSAIWSLDGSELVRTSLAIVITSGFAAVFGLVLLPLLPQKIQELKPIAPFVSLGNRTGKFLFRKKSAPFLILYSAINQSFAFISLFFIGQGLNLGLGLLEIFYIAPGVFLITMIPISIGGWGLRESAMAAGLALFLIPHDSALLLSILFGIISIIINLPGGLLWLTARKQETGIA